jgi:uncharacterized protein YjiS (DUF1127 family)
MAAAENHAPFLTSGTSDALILRRGFARITAVETGRRGTGSVLPSAVRAWRRVLGAFGSIVVQPIRTWIRLDRDASGLAAMDARELRDLGINRVDIAAIRAGTYKRASSDDAERIVFCPEAGKFDYKPAKR